MKSSCVIRFSCLTVSCGVMLCRCTDTVRVYDYLTKSPLCMSRFNAAGACMLWAPKLVSKLLSDTVLFSSYFDKFSW